ncbi:hypothetical protein E2C01_020209 [Portunus trituberculatus]|uniref:Uncharacterized protein n=1 Tax=Portunus trituberculatus TaxID=210409 RepID=A0A5B7E0P6_PORTR|nr:hypothetical protein [Portunus trituberculatus]
MQQPLLSVQGTESALGDGYGAGWQCGASRPGHPPCASSRQAEVPPPYQLMLLEAASSVATQILLFIHPSTPHFPSMKLYIF